MRNFLITLAYDGTRFSGWQRLPNARNIQGTIEAALAKVLDEEVQVSGSGRTDAGVHALCQVANFHSATKLPPETLGKRLSAQLSDEISLLSIEEAEERFHARLNCLDKTYRYRIRNVPLASPFDRLYTCHVPEKLDLERMREAAEAFLGTHNFQSFTNLKEKGKSFERRVDSIACLGEGVYIDILFKASGFLHNQARIMAAALVEAGAGRLDRAGIAAILEARDRTLAPGMAEAKGLALVEVRYPGAVFPRDRAPGPIAARDS